MGSMKITQGGLRLSGRTLVTDRLVATAIRARSGRPLLIESAANITLNARNTQGRLVNSLKLSECIFIFILFSSHLVTICGYIILRNNNWNNGLFIGHTKKKKIKKMQMHRNLNRIMRL